MPNTGKPSETVPMFVRLQFDAARAIDRLIAELGVGKTAVVHRAIRELADRVLDAPARPREKSGKNPPPPPCNADGDRISYT